MNDKLFYLGLGLTGSIILPNFLNLLIGSSLLSYGFIYDNEEAIKYLNKKKKFFSSLLDKNIL